MNIADILPAMTERIVRCYDPLAIILFGSHARGEAGPWSDVDLLVVLPEPKDPWKTKGDIQDLTRDLPVSVDATVTTPEEIGRRGDMVGTVLRPALREGRLLYAKGGNGHLPEAGPVAQEDADKEAALWLVFADDDVALAERLARNPAFVTRHAGYNAQQGAEKALKAIYVFLQIQYPFSHNLDELRDGLPAGWRLKEEFPDLKALSTWAVTERYPGAQGELTRQEVRRHVRQARALLEAVRREMEERGFTA